MKEYPKIAEDVVALRQANEKLYAALAWLVHNQGSESTPPPGVARTLRLFKQHARIDDLVCLDCGGPGVTWEDGYVLCDACARKRAVAAQIDGWSTDPRNADAECYLVQQSDGNESEK